MSPLPSPVRLRAVEKHLVNNFVYDTITPDPGPVAWMVRQLLCHLDNHPDGHTSDRTVPTGAEENLYPVGTCIRGLMTILFPMTAFVKNALPW